MEGTILVFAFLVAFLISFLTTPAVKSLAGKIGAMDVPKDDRRMHKKPIPLIGGLAIFYGFVASVLLLVPLEKDMAGILVGALIIVVLGLFDDVYCLSAKAKLPVQIIAAAIPVLCGLRIERMTMTFMPNGVLEFGYFAIPITIIWIVGITNAVNFIDGLDGLAVGVSSIASLAVFCIALMAGELRIALLTAALTGACFGFLPYNFSPASIFMGDTGATFLGYILSTVSILGLFKAYAVISFAVPFLVLGLPIFDTGFAIIRRIKNKQPIMTADRGHLHHRLIDIGLSQKQSVLIIYGICFLLGICAIVITNSGTIRKLLLIVVIISAYVFTYRNFFTIKKAIDKNKIDKSEKL